MAHRLDETLRKGTIMSVKKMAPKAALWAGLDVAAAEALDKESWFAGEAAYEASQNRGETLDESFTAALNAAAPNGGTWLEARSTIYKVLFGKQAGNAGNKKVTASAAIRRVTNRVSSAFAKPESAQNS